jgi:GH35 family endo-1,4-beta-xylanase
MKLNRIILPVASLALLLSGCYDEKMEWGRPDGYGDVTIAEMPLALAEQIANYDYIKNYATKHMPGVAIGLGLGADLYIGDEDYKTVADNNFQMFTTGNAMKHSSVVKSNGTMDFTTIDKFLAAVPEDIQIYGHNFIWHTQQQQTYLKNVIAPEQVIEIDQADVCANVIGNSGFEGGSKDGLNNLWGKYTYDTEKPGHGGADDYAMHFTMTDETSQNWDSQLTWNLNDALVDGETYAWSIYIKSDCNLTVQFIGQGTGAIYKDFMTAGSTWTYYSGEFTFDESGAGGAVTRVGIQFGGTPGSNLWVDDFKFGKKVESTVEPEKLVNILTNSDFEDGTTNPWGCWGSNNPTKSLSDDGEGYDGGHAMVLVNPVDGGAGNGWKAQCAYTLDEPLEAGKIYMLQFYAKAETAGGQIQAQYQNTDSGNQGLYKDFDITTSWAQYEVEFSTGHDDTQRIVFNIGAYANTYYIDNVKFGLKVDQSSASTSKRKSASPAKTRAGIYYVPKSAAEKRAALLEAMESWIKGMYEHLDGRVLNYDVINEPIADNHAWRGIGGNFMSGDTTPEETEDSGLKLNWDDGHFYWGYFIGEDYGVKAFEYARKYAPEGSHLFVNDYGLESSPGKLAALIEFVKYIDDNSTTQVDGIGTQMHVSTSITRDEIDAMFKTLAATGKLIRVTELDVSVGTTTPSTEELATQAEVYQMVFDSYRENVPTAQQSGITIWSLTDNSREHEYWLPKDAPNIFDSKYGRKHAYKGVCDGIAGYDISTDFDGTQWQ